MRRRYSIQFLLGLSFSVFSVLIIAVVSTLLYSRFNATAKENAYRNSQQIVDQVSYNLENYIQDSSELFSMILHTIGQSNDAKSDSLREQLDAMTSTRSDIVSLVLADEQGRLILDLPNVELNPALKLTEEDWFQGALDTPGHLTISLPHVQKLYKQQFRWVVSLSQTVTVRVGGKPVRSVLTMDINFNRIDELSKRVSLGRKGYIYILDEAGGNIVYHPQLELIYAGLKSENVELALNKTYGFDIDRSSGPAKLISVQTIGNVGWKVVGVSYLSEVLSTGTELNRQVIDIILALLLVVGLLSTLVSGRISRPIRRLESSMRSVERGELDTVAGVDGPLEVHGLAERFNHMIATIKQLMTQIVAEQESKRKYELEALQAQINPHFLYNTLNTVVRMVGRNKNEEVVRMITSLSKLFRISLSKGKSLIPISDELEHARNYLIIQQMRFKNKFDYSFDIQDEVSNYYTLKLIVQPLIENALMHGIEPSVDKGHIEVSAKLEGSDVVIKVADNGLGMSEDQLRRILSGTVSVRSKGSGVGVRNVQERIRLYFGDSYGLSFESELEVGTVVTIRLPARTKEQIEEGGSSHD